MTVIKETPVQESRLPESKIGLPEPPPRSESTRVDNGRQGGFLRLFRREREEVLTITGYLVDGLSSDKPVIVQTGATILGHIIAPKITVDGTISGSVYGREVEIGSSGQIWGDVFAVMLQIHAGGKVQGWVSSIEEEDLQRFYASGSLIDETHLISQIETLSPRLDTTFLTRNESQMETLHLLQAELATTLAARYEMEQDFEKRLAEMAGEAYNKINTLTEQLTAVRGELAGQKKQLDESQEIIRHQKKQVERQSNELSIARDLMTDQNQELSDLRELHNQLFEKYNTLLAEKTDVDAALESISREKDLLAQRVASLDIANRNNLQYQADQEDSLMRWQELAEITEKKANELTSQLQQAAAQLQESQNIIQLLREQRHELETELDQALLELKALQANKTRPLADPQIVEEATRRISQLEEELAHAEQEHLEQIIWYKANLETSRVELEHARETAVQQTEQIAALQQTVDALQAEMGQHQDDLHTVKLALEQAQAANQQELGHWQTAVVEKEMEWRQQSLELEQTITMLKADRKNMQATLRESQMQLSAAEGEVSRYLQETKSQGTRLAEIHTHLVERDIQLQQATTQLAQARQMIEKQKAALTQMKEMAAEKIRSLQTENAQLRRRIGK